MSESNLDHDAGSVRMPANFDSDFGGILHHHSQTLMRLFLSLTPVMNYLGDSPFEAEVSPEEIDAALMQPVQALSRALENLFEKIGSSWDARGVSADVRTELDEVRTEIIRY